MYMCYLAPSYSPLLRYTFLNPLLHAQLPAGHDRWLHATIESRDPHRPRHSCCQATKDSPLTRPYSHVIPDARVTLNVTGHDHFSATSSLPFPLLRAYPQATTANPTVT
jgi:hypothetical protein